MNPEFQSLPRGPFIWDHIGWRKGTVLQEVTAAALKNRCGAFVTVQVLSGPETPDREGENEYHYRARTMEQRNRLGFMGMVNLHPEFDHGHERAKSLAIALVEKILGVDAELFPSGETGDPIGSTETIDEIRQDCVQIGDAAKFNGRIHNPVCLDATTIGYYECGPGGSEPARKKRSCIDAEKGLRSCLEPGGIRLAHCSEQEADRDLEELLRILLKPDAHGIRLIDKPNRLRSQVYRWIGPQLERLWSDQAKERLGEVDWAKLDEAWKDVSRAIRGARDLNRWNSLDEFLDAMVKLKEERRAYHTPDYYIPTSNDYQRTVNGYHNIFDSPIDWEAWDAWQWKIFIDESIGFRAERMRDARMRNLEEISKAARLKFDAWKKKMAIQKEYDEMRYIDVFVSEWIPGMYYTNPYLREYVMNNPDASFADKFDTFIGYGGQLSMLAFTSVTIKGAGYGAKALTKVQKVAEYADLGLSINEAIYATSNAERLANIAAILVNVAPAKISASAKRKTQSVMDTIKLPAPVQKTARQAMQGYELADTLQKNSERIIDAVDIGIDMKEKRDLLPQDDDPYPPDNVP